MPCSAWNEFVSAVEFVRPVRQRIERGPIERPALLAMDVR